MFQHTSHSFWQSSFGTDYQENTLEFLLLKCALTEFLVKFASRLSLKAERRRNTQDDDFLARPTDTEDPRHPLSTELLDISDRMTRMSEQMVADHPFWLELHRLGDIVESLYCLVNSSPQPTPMMRAAYSTYGLTSLLANLNMVEAQAGTARSLHKGAAAVQAFAYASVFTCFAGERGRGSLYSSEILDIAVDNYAGATRDNHYRLHLLRFLKNLHRCQKKRFPAATNPLTDVYPPWKSGAAAAQRQFFYNNYDDYINLEAKSEINFSLVANPLSNKKSGQSEDRVKHLTPVQATIEQGFRVWVTPTPIPATVTQDEEDLYFRAMLGLVKCGVKAKQEQYCNVGTAASTPNIHNYTPQPDLQFVVDALLKNPFDKELVGAALNLATTGSKTAWRFGQTLAAAEDAEEDEVRRQLRRDANSNANGGASSSKRMRL